MVELEQLAAQTALKAGEFIQAHIHKISEISFKTTGGSLASSIVTEVDVACQELMLKELKGSMIEYDLGLLAEESDDDETRYSKNYFWCIDPIDGTLAFTENVWGYSVSIALVSSLGIPVIGVVYDVRKRALYQASLGNGARRNAISWYQDESESDTLHLYADRSALETELFREVSSSFRGLATDLGFQTLQLTGGAGSVLNGIGVIQKPNGLYFKPIKQTVGGGCIWDFAATACIVLELGGAVSDVCGRPIDFNKKHLYFNDTGVLYASNDRIKQGFLDWFVHQ